MHGQLLKKLAIFLRLLLILFFFLFFPGKPKSAVFTSFAMVRSRKGNANDDSVGRSSSSGSRSVSKLESNETTAQREGAPAA